MVKVKLIKSGIKSMTKFIDFVEQEDNDQEINLDVDAKELGHRMYMFQSIGL